jgi:hypothetical protein
MELELGATALGSDEWGGCREQILQTDSSVIF